MDNNNNNNNQRGYHYYSYGKLPDEREQREEDAIQERTEDIHTEMTPPRELKMYPLAPQTQRPQPSSYSQTRPRRSAFKSVFASFLAGAVVVGSLMFASDRMNLFSGSDVLANSSATVSGAANGVTTATGSGTGSLSTASIDVVRPNTIAEMVKKASPAVVLVETYASASQRGSNSLSPFFDDPLFREFFGDGSQSQRQQGSAQEQPVKVGAGSGFFFDKEGYILTNEHVVDGASEIKVTVEGRKEPYTAKLLGTAYELDLAVLKIDGDGNFPVLPLGSSENIQVGDWVVAIGNPYEFEHSVTVGVLSAKERSFDIPDSQGTRKYQALLQTDASINPGNSGGPLLNLNGEVIGINTAVNAQAQGIGFAIPTSTITDVLESLKANKKIPRPFIGIAMENVQQQWIDDLGLKNTDGAFVREVTFGSPAHKAGIKVYDVILGVDGAEIKNADDLSNVISKKKPGDKVALKVMRDGKEMTVNVTIGDRNDQTEQ
ncbi:S1C family serine protease [Paenibacillus alkalitolerans]|uniref:S1C family serine protease n=1 Tax=Paenibacillus alkalitolerans TaxID=2799335 RepID=UPI0018F33896|nr:trypsin-like peptidase domain-containing protein [Paenibacillus alkalitolerans]